MDKLSLKKILILTLVLMLLAVIFAGCSGGNKTGDGKKPSSAQPSADQQGKTSGPEELTLPIVKEPLTLTCFKPMETPMATVIKDYNEVACFNETEKRTGIHIEWQQPPQAQAQEQFNLMIASRELPDMIFWNWTSVSGGPAKMIEEGIIIKLNDLIKQYAPNLQKLFDDYPID